MWKEGDDDTVEDIRMWQERRDYYSAVSIHIDNLLQESNYSIPSKPTIFPVDHRLRKVNHNDYEPKIVSIGPIHRGKEQVWSMEEHKVRLLRELMAEKEGVITLEMLVEEVGKKEEDVHGCYSSESVDLSSHPDFLKIMILDGCFIIQLIRRYRSAKPDPILEPNTLIQIMHDLLLFENQLPFFVLTALFDKIKTGNPTDNLHDLILFLVGDIVPWFDDPKTKLLPKPRHLLELVYGCISIKRPSNPNSTSFSSSLIKLQIKITSKLINGWEREKSWARAKKSPVIHINSASDLKEVAGIHVRMSTDNNLTFAGRVLRFPALQVSNETESLLRNLMAYEQLQLGDDQPRQVIDYVFFLQCLARSTKDVEILRYGGVIKNFLGVDNQILQMIERLGTNFMRSPDYTYSDAFEGLGRYYSFRRHGWVAYMERTYFNTPWSMPKVSAATLLLVLVALQTYFAWRSFRRQTSN